MKIGIDARALTAAPSGIGIYLANVLDALQAVGAAHRFYLISSDTIFYEPVRSNWTKIEAHLNKPLVGSAWMQMKVPAIAHRIRLDLYWGPRHHLPLLLPRRIRTVLTIHDVVHRLYPGTMAFPNLLLERMLMRLSVHRADRIITDSASTARDLQTFYPAAASKTRVVHPGVPMMPSDDGQPLPEDIPSRYVLFVGTLEPRKNFERLLQAYWQSDPERHGVHLVVVGGKGWKSDTLRRRLESPPWDRYVTLTGYVSRCQLQRIYRQALCVAFPSLYEGFGFPILEAMACGTPVLTASVSSMPEVAGDAAFLVDPYDVKSICRAIQLVISDEALCRRLAEKGLKQCRRFRWDAYAEALLHIFENRPAANADLS
jgi:glycosyltransferase involved in cell wall biosynthesis